MNNDKPTTELVRLEADSDATHALLCAVLRAKRTADRGGAGARYAAEYRAWFDVIEKVYYSDRRDEDRERRYAAARADMIEGEDTNEGGDETPDAEALLDATEDPRDE